LLGLPYGDNEFDVVICNHVLEHIDDDAKAISEIYRVTIVGGLAILQVPISNQLEVTYEDAAIKGKKQREKHFGQFDHVRIYGKDYKSRLENAGFMVQTYSPLEEKSNKATLNKFALNTDEKLYVAHKN
jgi:ubiquinone/menaquinone biosynthesis C-methylase UbiE